MPIRALLFDMDGVLVANTSFHVVAWQAYATKLGRSLSQQEIVRLLGFTNAGYLAYILGREPSKEEVREAVREKESLYRDLFRPHLHAPEGLIPLLQTARAEGVRCAVVTSGPVENVDFVLDGLRIRPFFDLLVHGASVVHPKPAPDCYLLAAQRLGIAPIDCVVVEDAVAGIQAGKAAGMRVCAITTSNPHVVLKETGADWVIDRFFEWEFSYDC